MKTTGIVLLGIGAVVILYLVSKTTSGSLGNYFGLGAASNANPSPLTPRVIGYNANGTPIFSAPTTTPYNPALTGVQSGVVNDTLLAAGLSNLGASILKVFAPGAPAAKGQVTPSSPAQSTMSAQDQQGAPTLADQGMSVSQGYPGVYGIDPLTGNVIVNPIPDPQSNSVQGPSISGTPLAFDYTPSAPPIIDPNSLSGQNNPIDYAAFGIPDALPPSNNGSGAGNGSYLANDYSGYNVPAPVVDLTAAPDALAVAV